jgi:hypothetical protein
MSDESQELGAASLRRALHAAADMLAEALSKQAGSSAWVSQEDSPLGKVRHCRLCRSGKLQGRRVGRLWLVRRSELDTFIETHQSRAPRSDPSRCSLDTVANDLLDSKGAKRRTG